jgi:hypothetical protein
MGSHTTTIGIHATYCHAAQGGKKRLSLSPHPIPKVEVFVGVPYSLSQAIGHSTL